jgi:hypothetical protein
MSYCIVCRTFPFRCRIHSRSFDYFFPVANAVVFHVFVGEFEFGETFVYGFAACYAWMYISPLTQISTLNFTSLEGSLP